MNLIIWKSFLNFKGLFRVFHKMNTSRLRDFPEESSVKKASIDSEQFFLFNKGFSFVMNFLWIIIIIIITKYHQTFRINLRAKEAFVLFQLLVCAFKSNSYHVCQGLGSTYTRVSQVHFWHKPIFSTDAHKKIVDWLIT